MLSLLRLLYLSSTSRRQDSRNCFKAPPPLRESIVHCTAQLSDLDFTRPMLEKVSTAIYHFIQTHASRARVCVYLTNVVPIQQQNAVNLDQRVITTHHQISTFHLRTGVINEDMPLLLARR